MLLLTSVVVPLSQTGARADGFDQQIAALQAQADSLAQGIGQDEQQSSAASQQAATVAQSLAQTQAQTASAQQHLDAANAALQHTTAQLQDTQAELAADRQQLGQMVVNMYQIRANGSVTRALVDSKSFVDAMAMITSVNQVSSRVKALVIDVQQREQQLAALQAQQQSEYQQAAAAVATLQALAAQQAAQQQQLQLEAAAMGGQAAAMTQQLQSIEVQLNRLQATKAMLAAVRVLGAALPPFAFGPRTDYFPWGQCTWYVASLRDVTWDGDAWRWAATAAAQGMPEGAAPQPGSIVVWAPGGGGSSNLGHVAYVEAVTGPHTFIVDEANVFGLGVVDQRVVNTLDGIETFIYAKPPS